MGTHLTSFEGDNDKNFIDIEQKHHLYGMQILRWVSEYFIFKFYSTKIIHRFIVTQISYIYDMTHTLWVSVLTIILYISHNNHPYDIQTLR